MILLGNFAIFICYLSPPFSTGLATGVETRELYENS